VNPANKWLIGLIPAALISGAALWEGTKYYAYKDIVGVPTVCQGYTGKDIVFGKKYTPEECNSYLRKELKVHSDGALACIKVPITEYQYTAYVLFTYNVGVSAFCNSTAAKLLNQKKYIESCDALLNWSYVTETVIIDGKSVKRKKFVQGLYNRRVYEVAICKGEGYVN